MKVVLKPKKIIKLILITIIIIALLSGFLYLMIKNRPITQVKHHRSIFTFRDNVRDAEKIRVTPDENQLNKAFWNYRMTNISYHYIPLDARTNGYYKVEIFELTNKLTQMYNTRKPITIVKNFDAEQITSFENITREDEVLKIIFVPPGLTNETYIRVGGNRIWIYAKNYRDFDLAVIKTILTAMWKYEYVS